jgi:phage/plasmid-like protein (TIGR03299 family)
MSHEIGQFEHNGEMLPTICYLEGGQLPWHGMGNVIAPGAPVEEWRIMAGLAFDVELRANCRADGTPIDSSYHIVRMDNGAIMGPYVAGQYVPFQTSAALDLAESICREHGFRFDTAGALFEGARGWFQIVAERHAELPGGDIVADTLVITFDHRGFVSAKIISTPVRVVCNNTLSMAVATATDTAAFTHRIPFDADSVVAAIGAGAKNFAAFAKLAHAMAGRVITDAERLEYFQNVIGGKEKEDDSGRVIRSVGVRRAMAFSTGRDFVAEGKSAPDVVRVVEEAIDRAARGSASDAVIVADDIVSNDNAVINPGHDMASAQSTLWGAFNTVTWLIDHNPAKNRGAQFALASNKLGEGTGGKVKARAVCEAQALIAA